jgi:hypothetical protein
MKPGLFDHSLLVLQLRDLCVHGLNGLFFRREVFAGLYQSTGRAAEACAILTPALDGFSPTAEMPEINEAQALLELWTHGA